MCPIFASLAPDSQGGVQVGDPWGEGQRPVVKMIREGRGAGRHGQVFLYLPHPRHCAGKAGCTTPILQMRQQIQSQQCSQDYTAGAAGFEPRIPTTTHMLSFHFPSSLPRKPGFLIKPHGPENASEGNAHLSGLEVLLLQAPASPVEAVIHQVLLHDTVLRVEEHVAGSTSGGLAYIIHCRQRGVRSSPGTFPPSGMTPTSLTAISPFSPVPLSPQAPPKIPVRHFNPPTNDESEDILGTYCVPGPV